LERQKGGVEGLQSSLFSSFFFFFSLGIQVSHAAVERFARGSVQYRSLHTCGEKDFRRKQFLPQSRGTKNIERSRTIETYVPYVSTFCTTVGSVHNVHTYDMYWIFRIRRT